MLRDRLKTGDSKRTEPQRRRTQDHPDEAGAPRKRFVTHSTMLLGVLAVSLGYLLLQIYRDWIPHDEGTMAQAAERILNHGEWPHRDLQGPYTGGLSFLHALAFLVLGVKLTTLRWVMLAFSMTFVAVVYRIAARVASPWLAAAVTGLCLVWSVPNYFFSIASWYNLFFAAFGTLALLRHIETNSRRSLFLAGLCGAFSFLAKTIGLYYVAAVLLFLVYREQTLAVERNESGPGCGYSLFNAVGLLAFCAVLLHLIMQRPTPMDFLHFFLPGVLLSLHLVWREWTLRSARGALRWQAAVRQYSTFLGGVLLPVALFVVPYLATSSLGAWVDGNFRLPNIYYDFLALPGPGSLLKAIPLIVVLASPMVWRKALGGLGVSLALSVACVGLLVTSDQQGVYTSIWEIIRLVVPVLAISGCITLSLPRRAEHFAATRGQQLFLLLAMAALTSLVQIPFAAGIYFCYAAPLVILALLFLLVPQHDIPKGIYLCLLAFFFLFAVLRLNWSSTYHLGFRYVPYTNTAQLSIPRGGLEIRMQQARVYRRLVEVIQEHSVEDAYIYAAPDAPEIYFLSARRNPTRVFFDLWEPVFREQPVRWSEGILATLDAKSVEVVVIRHNTEFTRGLPPHLLRAFRERFPEVEELPGFSVRWRSLSRSSG